MLVPEELPGFAASADSRRRCISSPCLCGSPIPSPSVEWTSPEAWPAAPPSISPVSGTPASAAMRRPANRLRPDRRSPQREHLLLDLALRPAVRELQPKVLTRVRDRGVGMVAAGRVSLRLRRDAGLGGTSWAAMMRPSCCSDSRPFAWGDSAKISCVPSSSMARPNWVGVPAG